MNEKEDKLFDDIQTFLSTAEVGEDDEKKGILDDIQIQSLILAFATSRGDEGFEEEELIRIVRWAEGISVGHTILNLIYEGYVLPNIIESEEEPVLTLSEAGKRAIDKLT